MGSTPFQSLGIWIKGLLSIILLALGPYLLYEWYEHGQVMQARSEGGSVPTTQAATQAASVINTRYERVFSPDWGFNRQTGLFVLGLGMLLWAIPKGPVLNLRRMVRRPGADEPHSMRTGEVHRLKRPDGSELHVETYGPADGPADGLLACVVDVITPSLSSAAAAVHCPPRSRC